MKMTVEPHDLEGVCTSLGVTLTWLSEETGIPVEELDLFAKGEHPLLARDRFAIFSRLAEIAPSEPRERTPVEMLKTGMACNRLFGEVREEEQEEDDST